MKTASRRRHLIPSPLPSPSPPGSPHAVTIRRSRSRTRGQATPSATSSDGAHERPNRVRAPRESEKASDEHAALLRAFDTAITTLKVARSDAAAAARLADDGPPLDEPAAAAQAAGLDNCSE